MQKPLQGRLSSPPLQQEGGAPSRLARGPISESQAQESVVVLERFLEQPVLELTERVLP